MLILCWLCAPVQAQNLSVTLLNGDCDGDNEVTLYDFGILVDAFGSVPGDPNWDPRADLDGDMEVTLFDFDILTTNFGQLGADPFDPLLPRQPAPQNGGYALNVRVDLERWYGAPKWVRVEAQREDDPNQVVYFLDNVPTGTAVTMRLPESGYWSVKVAGASGFLAAQHTYKRRYSRTPRINAFFVTPREGEEYADKKFSIDSIGVRVHAVDMLRREVSGTLIPSGADANNLCFPEFLAGSRRGAWKLESVTFDTPWGRQEVPGDEYGRACFVGPAIAQHYEHGWFDFSATALFSIQLPPPVGRQEIQVQTTARALLGFDMEHPEYNELLDDSRGRSIFGVFEVPNWFHDLPGHWGSIIPRFNEEYTYGGQNYPIVHWAAAPTEDILDMFEEEAEQLRALGVHIAAFFDFLGLFAPEEHQFDEEYRGRIYLFPSSVQRNMVCDTYGLNADWNDLLMKVVVHEFAHRDLFVSMWGGFATSNIGGARPLASSQWN